MTTEIHVPAPTAWPIVLAAGVALMWAGLLTDVSITVLGTVLAGAGSVGWFRAVLPHDREIALPVIAEDVRIATERTVVERVPVAAEQVRAWLPVQTYPVSAGIKGGWAGSVAMAVVACAYGLVSAGSIWYPINLLCWPHRSTRRRSHSNRPVSTRFTSTASRLRSVCTASGPRWSASCMARCCR
jgi:hypothetical protein